MKNQSIVSEFLFLGLFYALFLVMCLTTVLGNLLIIVLIQLDSHLPMPMYFFSAICPFLASASPLWSFPNCCTTYKTKSYPSLMQAAWPRCTSCFCRIPPCGYGLWPLCGHLLPAVLHHHHEPQALARPGVLSRVLTTFNSWLHSAHGLAGFLCW